MTFEQRWSHEVLRVGQRESIPGRGKSESQAPAVLEEAGVDSTEGQPLGGRLGRRGIQ